MTTNAKKPTEPSIKPPKVKEHAVLRNLETQLRGTQITDTFEVSGHKYTLRTLWPFEESWADGFVRGENFYQQGRGRRVPYVAAALAAIDGVDVRELFQLPDDTPDAMREVYLAEPELMADWRRRAVLMWLAGPEAAVPAPVLQKLWESYATLEERQREALEAIGPLSPTPKTGTPGTNEASSGGLPLMFAPENKS